MIHDKEQRILALLAEEQKLTARDAAEKLGISGASVRRIFRQLAEAGEVRRIHGAIESINRGFDPAYPFNLRMQWFAEEKRVLAERTLPLISGCRTVFIDGGTTTAHLGILLNNPNMRIITNSLALNNILLQKHASESPEIILTGGRVNRKSAILLGPETVETIDRFHADAAIISGSAIDEFALYDNMEDAAAVQRRMIANSDRLIVVADASKFGRKAPSRVVPVEKISQIVSNFISENYHVVQEIKQKGIEFIFN